MANIIRIAAVRIPASPLSAALTVHGVPLNPICQEEPYNPGQDVSINPNKNSILTPQRPVPDVRLGYTSNWTEQDNAVREREGFPCRSDAATVKYEVLACIYPRDWNTFIENLLFHRARKFYFWVASFQGKLAAGDAYVGQVPE